MTFIEACLSHFHCDGAGLCVLVERKWTFNEQNHIICVCMLSDDHPPTMMREHTHAHMHVCIPLLFTLTHVHALQIGAYLSRQRLEI